MLFWNKTGKVFFHVKTQRKVMSLFWDFLQCFPPPPLPDCLKNSITFFLFGLCWVWKSMLTKVFTLSVFQIFLSLSVSHHFCPQNAFFWLKIAYIDGKQTNQKYFYKNEIFECLRCFYIPWLYQKLQIGANYDCSNTRRWWGK